MGRIQTLLHDPATLISLGVGFLVLLVVALIFMFKNRKGNTSRDSVAADATEGKSQGDKSLAFLYGDTSTPRDNTSTPHPGTTESAIHTDLRAGHRRSE